MTESELLQGYELLFKSVGLWFLTGSAKKTSSLLQNSFLFASMNGYLEPDEIDQLNESLRGNIAEAEYGELFCLGNSSLSLYESVWETGLVMQEPRDQFLGIMKSLDLAIQTDSNEPEDHLGIILFTMGAVLERLREYSDQGSSPNDLLQLIRKIRGHLNWLLPLATEVNSRGGKFHFNMLKITQKAVDDIVGLTVT